MDSYTFTLFCQTLKDLEKGKKVSKYAIFK